MTASAPKLLTIAYACAPQRGSEWGLGWNFARELARTQPVWVITHKENQPLIEPYLAANPTEHPIHFEYVTMPHWVNWIGAMGYMLFNVQYYLWIYASARAARRLHERHRFDIVQHISLMRWWMPSPGATLARQGVKFIFGPVGGGELMPRQFRKGVSLTARLGECVRHVAVKFWSFDPMLKRTIRGASVVLASTPQTAHRLEAFGPRKLLTINGGIMSAADLIDAGRAHRAALPARRPFRFVSSGGLSYFRGVDLALRAFARANLPDAEYVHASDGPDRPRLEALAVELGIADRVKFLGDAPHAENVKVVATADVYVHTVLRDSMGLMPEAMAMGIPVLTLDHNTMAVMVNEQVGHKIAIDDQSTPQQVIDALAEWMARWHEDSGERRRLGEAGVSHSKQFTATGRLREYRACHAIALAERAPVKDLRRASVPPETPVSM
jgi:glycosyltransferase involved in cell wall biosynthesis